MGEKGEVVPSTNKLLDSIFEIFLKITGMAIPHIFQSAIFILIAAVVVFFSYKACARLKYNETDNRAILQVFMVCLVYALIHPRFKDYGYILLLLPSYYIIVNSRFTKFAPFLFILFILSNHMMLPMVDSIYDIIWTYYPLAVAYGVWGIYLHEIFSGSTD